MTTEQAATIEKTNKNGETLLSIAKSLSSTNLETIMSLTNGLLKAVILMASSKQQAQSTLALMVDLMRSVVDGMQDEDWGNSK